MLSSTDTTTGGRQITAAPRSWRCGRRDAARAIELDLLEQAPYFCVSPPNDFSTLDNKSTLSASSPLTVSSRLAKRSPAAASVSKATKTAWTAHAHERTDAPKT
jgi:hypothetical protein